MNLDLLEPKTVASLLHVSSRTLAKWRYKHTGPEYVRLGYNRVVYSRQAVEDWISQRSAL